MPLAALGQQVNGKQFWVQVMVNGQPEMRQIEIGIRDNQFVQVVSGLKAGDRVIPFSASDKGAQK
jgi:macrolide-specific efflux system membrane fusion protein